MSDQFATGVHFMIFYLSFASRPNKLHHKYFRMSGLAPYSLQYIILPASLEKFYVINIFDCMGTCIKVDQSTATKINSKCVVLNE